MNGFALIRGTYENKHGYRCGQVVRTSSAREHDIAALRSGFPDARNVHVLEAAAVPEDIRRSGRMSSYRAYVSLAGGDEMRLTLEEYIGVMRQLHDAGVESMKEAGFDVDEEVTKR